MGEADKRRDEERNKEKRQKGNAMEADAGRKSNGQVPFFPLEIQQNWRIRVRGGRDETRSKTRLFTCLLSGKRRKILNSLQHC